MRTAHRVVVASLAAVSLGLTACGGPGDPTATSPPPSVPATASPSAPTPSTPAPTAAPTPAPTATAPSVVTPSAAQPPASEPAPPSPSPQPPLSPPPAPAPSPASGLPAAWRDVDLERIATERRVVALTFDGGSSDAAVSSILATLDRYDVPATFFVTGAFARTYPHQARAMAAAGHPVGNHSATHVAYPELTDVQIRADLASAEASISAASGAAAKPLFRFPYGSRTAWDIRVVNEAGYLPVRWTVDSLGCKGTSGGLSVDEVVRRVVSTAVPGQIVLMHLGANPEDGTTLDAAALPRIIDELRARGYGFVDLSAVGR